MSVSREIGRRLSLGSLVLPAAGALLGHLVAGSDGAVVGFAIAALLQTALAALVVALSGLALAASARNGEDAPASVTLDYLTG